MTDAEHADDVRVEEITCYRGFCPRCTWHTMDFLDPDSPRRAVEYHLKLIHNDGSPQRENGS